jgi:hypothetical protein
MPGLRLAAAVLYVQPPEAPGRRGCSGQGRRQIADGKGRPRRQDGHGRLRPAPKRSLPEDLAQKLKRECGTGGTFTEDRVELQGELRDKVRTILQRLGYTVKG